VANREVYSHALLIGTKIDDLGWP